MIDLISEPRESDLVERPLVAAWRNRLRGAMADRGGPGTTGTKSEHERLDRNLLELLNELRVALPGVQVLFAFLLIVPFSERFKDLTATQEGVYYAALLADGDLRRCS